jgi:ssDNA-binding Zn-finger/Zn-ribbon topoisomerase 1
VTDFGVICGDCASPMVLRETSKFMHTNGTNRKFWGCSRWPECSGVLGAHPDGSPMGIAGDKATRLARIAAHAAFDAAWRARGMTRDEAYLWLQELTGLTRNGAHISKFDETQCRALVRAIALSEAVRECAADAEVTA